MFQDEKAILEAELYKLSPIAQEIMKKFFAELDAVKAFVLLSPEVFVIDAVAEVGAPVFADIAEGDSDGDIVVSATKEAGLGVQTVGEEEQEEECAFSHGLCDYAMLPVQRYVFC